MTVYIDNSITNILNDFDIIALKMDVTLEDSERISDLITHYEKTISEEYSLEEILNIPLIKEARDGYKKLGKDPSRYRLACESLLRRIVKGNKLYKINNLVDAGNILSIESKRSVAVLDYDKIVGDVLVRLGTEDDEYYGIGRGKLNVSNIPVYVDEIGPFGSTTSDTERTAISDDTKTILLFIICFGPSLKEEHKSYAISLFEKYANAQNITNISVRK
jgi:DNA/RNA-binding domain of Phe-tRNA-synthetase-like protein